MNYKKRSKLVINLALLAFSAITLIPIYFLVINAFKQKNFIYQSPMTINREVFTTESITKAFSLMKFPQSLLNSVAVLVISCAGLILLGSMAAYAITVNRCAWTRRLYTIMVALVTVPVSCAQIPLAKELSSMGLNNTWLGTSIAYIAFGLPFTIFIFTGYAKSIPHEIWEAAKMDGCKPLQAYVYVFMPLIKMTTATVIIMRGTYIWNDILVPMITITSGNGQTLPQRLVTFASSNIARWDLMFAATLLVSVPILILYLCLQKLFIGALTAGSVKG